MMQLLSLSHFCLSPAPLHRRGLLALEIADGLSAIFRTYPLSFGEGLGERFKRQFANYITSVIDFQL